MNIRTLLMAIVLIGAVACDKENEQASTRTYRMGFQNSSPRFDDLDMAIKSLNMWTTRADAAMITTEVPWKKILDGTDPVDYVVENYKDLVAFYRGKNLKLWVYIDPTNGLDRSADSRELVEAGKSIADKEMQAIYRRFVVVMDSVLNPDHLGLALETNLIRSSASASIYSGVRIAANQAALDISDRNSNVKLSISLQAEQAWGIFSGQGYQGTEQDFIDFSFMQEVGISSYPYFGFDKPSDIPVNYYTRFLAGHFIPAFVTEGGWTSASIETDNGVFESSNEIQKEYIDRHAELLKSIGAEAWFQLPFTDIDMEHVPGDVPANLAYFAYLGLVDKNFEAKPSLNAWDEIFKRTFVE